MFRLPMKLNYQTITNNCSSGNPLKLTLSELFYQLKNFDTSTAAYFQKVGSGA